MKIAWKQNIQLYKPLWMAIILWVDLPFCDVKPPFPLKKALPQDSDPYVTTNSPFPFSGVYAQV